MNNELTDWINGNNFTPFRVGFYERDDTFHRRNIISFWDGSEWLYKSGYTHLAQNLKWRGLKHNPKVSK